MTSRCDALVFFGSTGDLAFKQIFPALQALTKAGRLDMPVVTVGRKDIGVDKMRARMKESLEKAGNVDAAALEKLSKNLSYVAVDYDDPTTFDGIKKAIGGAKHPLSYVALPPDVFEKVARNLDAAGLAKGGRLALEKPFGHDAASAAALSKALHPFFDESRLYRIDHFLGKEPIENLVYFRAANAFLEDTLDHEHVSHIEITMAEKFGVKGRAEFYDAVGAMRDVVQNHLLELLACLTMEVPEAQGHEALRSARAEALSHVRTMDPKDYVRGQVRGYLAEEGVAKDSKTETFAALRLHLDSPRWEGVPVYIRAGKSLPVTATEAIVHYKAPDHAVLDDEKQPGGHLRFRLGPDAAIALGVSVKKGGEAMSGECVELVLQRPPKEGLLAYERLLGDALDGDPTMFADERAVTESWRVVDPIVGNDTPVHVYEEATWGPKEVDTIAPEGGWTNPIVKA